MSINQGPIGDEMINSAIARLRSAARFAGFGAALFLLHIAQAGAYPVVPDAQTSVEGNSENGFPFSIALSQLSSQRYQQAYSASEFPASILITDLEFRPDAFFGGPFAATLPNILIQLSARPGLVDHLSSTFAANVGANVLTVYAGSLPLSSGFTGRAGGPKAFDIVINLQTPFNYNPSNGDLLLDVTNFGGGYTTLFDAQSAFGDAVSRVFSRDANAVSGSTDDSGLVTLFTSHGNTVTVPEPGTISLVGLAMAGLWRSGRSVAAKA